MAPAIYIEAQIDPEYGISLSSSNHELKSIFTSGLIDYAKLNFDMRTSDIYGLCFPDHVVAIKAVEYTESSDPAIWHDIKGCTINISSYVMRDDDDVARDLRANLSSTNPRLLPASFLEDTWERLVFDTDIKESVLRQLTSSFRVKNLNRLILLTGSPGTGKTTLAQALAQKLSIRLNGVFPATYLLHLRAAALLSQFFGESAKQIHDTFASIEHLSSANPATLYVLVIDEIESLAGSRSRANAQGEVQDAVRATNELLIGFDTIKNRRNVVIICTSNLLDSLDEAFVDRCSRSIVVPAPGAAARYEILRYSLQTLVEDELIILTEHDSLPKYGEAISELESEFGTAGIKLRSLVDSFDDPQNNGPVSARWLGQLPELVFVNHVGQEDTCTLTEAVQLMQRYVVNQGFIITEPLSDAKPSLAEPAADALHKQGHKRGSGDDGNGNTVCSVCWKKLKLAKPSECGDESRDTIVVGRDEELERVKERLLKLENLALEQHQMAHPFRVAAPNQADESGVQSPARLPSSNADNAPDSSASSGGKGEKRLLHRAAEPSDDMILDDHPRVSVQHHSKQDTTLANKLSSEPSLESEEEGIQ